MTLNDLTEKEHVQVMTALELMASGPGNKPESETLTEAQKAEEREKKTASG